MAALPAACLPHTRRVHVDRETELVDARDDGRQLRADLCFHRNASRRPEALTFVINRETDRYVKLDIEETARLIATGRGVRGTSLEYLENVAERLELLGLHDPDLDDLLQRARSCRTRGHRCKPGRTPGIRRASQAHPSFR